MNLIDFADKFSDEERCKLKVKEMREHEGIKCRNRGNETHCWKRDKEMFECKKCGTRTSLNSGTVMHKSKLPYRYWFIVMHLLTSIRKTFSAKEIHRQLRHKGYQAIWHMMHKLRSAMWKRDANYELCGEMELDDEFFSTPVSKEEKDEPLKRGRYSLKRSQCLL